MSVQNSLIESNFHYNYFSLFYFFRRAKLYRFFTEKDETGWKERGVGEMKIMKHKTKGTFRIVMRRDKTLKLCANHASEYL